MDTSSRQKVSMAQTEDDLQQRAATEAIPKLDLEQASKLSSENRA